MGTDRQMLCGVEQMVGDEVVRVFGQLALGDNVRKINQKMAGNEKRGRAPGDLDQREQRLGPQAAEIGRREPAGYLRTKAEYRIAHRPSVVVQAGDPGRAVHVVDGPGVRAGVDTGARIAASGAGPMTGPASNGVVARQLLVPEQDLAEHALGLAGWILVRIWHGRQRARERRRRPEHGDKDRHTARNSAR